LTNHSYIVALKIAIQPKEKLMLFLSHRRIGIILFALLLAIPTIASAKCIIGKKSLITVLLTEDRPGTSGPVTVEGVTTHKDGRPGVAFRIRDVINTPWRIPIECKKDMESILSKEDITLVMAAMSKK
jgi:hypothetical protein